MVEIPDWCKEDQLFRENEKEIIRNGEGFYKATVVLLNEERSPVEEKLAMVESLTNNEDYPNTNPLVMNDSYDPGTYRLYLYDKRKEAFCREKKESVSEPGWYIKEFHTGPLSD